MKKINVIRTKKITKLFLCPQNLRFFWVLLIILILLVVSCQKIDKDPGVTPDSFLWGLDKALDQSTLILTFDEGEKAKKGLDIAGERLLEVKSMIEENKLEAAEKAQEEHEKTLAKVKQSIKDIEEDPLEEIKEVIEIEKELEEHEREVEQTFGELIIKIEVEGQVTQQQKDLIDSILNSLKGQIGEVEIEIKNKKDKTKIKIKVKTGKSEAEIEKEVEDIEEETGLTRDRAIWAQKAIEHAEEKIATAEEKIAEKIAEGFNVTIAEDFLTQAKDMLAQAKVKFNAEEYKEARKLAQDAGILAMHAKRGKSFEKIEVEEAEEEIELEESLEEINDTREKLMKLQEKGIDVSEELEELTRIETEFKEGLFTGDLEEALESIEDKAKAKEEVEEETEEELECSFDTDCKEGEICTDGKCEKVEEPECTVDTDCKEDEACIEGTCEKIEE
ncbi:hypothetical protein JYT91_01130 [archaeon AH-315-M20]|nr:hypothetical protein [archaeon AH-315-M20]